DKRIAITGLISSIDDADPANQEHINLLNGFADKGIVYHFDDFEFTNVVRLLKDHPTIKSVYFTRGIIEAFWKHLWNPVMQYCKLNGIHERRLITPSTEASYHLEAYNKEHPEPPLERLEDY